MNRSIGMGCWMILMFLALLLISACVAGGVFGLGQAAVQGLAPVF